MGSISHRIADRRVADEDKERSRKDNVTRKLEGEEAQLLGSTVARRPSCQAAQRVSGVMTNRAQFYIRQEMDFGRPDQETTSPIPTSHSIYHFSRNVFLGLSIAFMFSIYGACVLYFLNKLDAPLPTEVKHVVAEAEYRISTFLNKVQQAHYNSRPQ